ncbi:MAG: class I SAM-dependent methyltransferase [Chloroflexi bacterium]|nr:class I SAM-dependent methyltransferase [Chloroflexota bacterium]MCI0646103.1 class I SAM-dependent methyltransferase [Chloroflexota bacterium]MCI0731571.1 class I SAM-dependent methyltransferase [Chloroflexota bacterium]
MTNVISCICCTSCTLCIRCVGSGTGRLLLLLAEAGFELYGLDLSEGMLNYNRPLIAAF